MTDKEVGIGTAVAVLLWIAVAAVMILAWVLDHSMLGQTGLVVSVAAATMTGRCFFVRHGRLMRAAFEMSRNTGSVRRVQ